MAMGFGQQMANSPMVVMWANSDGSVTLSQRQAASETMPRVVTSPARVATLSQSLTTSSGSQPAFGYAIPVRPGFLSYLILKFPNPCNSQKNDDTQQSIIWAFG